MLAGAEFVVAAGLIAACSGSSGNSSSSSSPSTLACPSKHGTAVTGTAAPAATGRPAADWTLPDGDMASTRYVASAITSANVSKLGLRGRCR